MIAGNLIGTTASGHGRLAAGLLFAVFMYTGWDATVYLNEEVRHRRVNPGRSAVIAVGFLVVIFTVATVGLQGVVSSARLQANSSFALVYVAQALGGPGWAKVMALALALSVIATTGVSIVMLTRIMYGSLAGIIAVGVVLMVFARFALRSPFFQTPPRKRPRPGGALPCPGAAGHRRAMSSEK